MKKIIFIPILLILITTQNKDLCLAETNKYINIIGSFNILHLGWNGKNYNRTAEVLINYDIVGLQEVMKISGINTLVYNLEKITQIDWQYHVSPYPVGFGRYKEYYAYIWKKDKVKIIKPLGFYKEKYYTDFIREPYGAIFKINNFDFTLVLCHLIFGKGKKYRRAEATKLIDVYDYFQKINGTEQDIIIAGDFNLPADDKGFSNLLCHTDKIKYIISSKEKTTITDYGLSNAYDNFFISNKYTHEVIFAIVYKPYIIDYSIFRRVVSDHLPIFLIINTKIDDD